MLDIHCECSSRKGKSMCYRNRAVSSAGFKSHTPRVPAFLREGVRTSPARTGNTVQCAQENKKRNEVRVWRADSVVVG